jgi:hypothetical protein
LVLLQPESTSSRPGAGGKYKSNGVDLRATKKLTSDEAKEREKDRVKERNRKKAGAIAKVELPIEVRTAWEQDIVKNSHNMTTEALCAPVACGWVSPDAP